MYQEKIVGLLFRSNGKGGGGFVNIVQCSDPSLCETPWLEFDTEVTLPFETVYAAI